MSILKKIKSLHEQDEHDEIIDLIENTYSREEMNCEIKGFLARAYNNNEDYSLAYDVLMDCEEEMSEDCNWNFRVGYALYYMDKSDEALEYFENSLKLNPNDPYRETTEELIQDCIKEQSLPLGVQSLNERIENFWQDFVEDEKSLIELFQQKDGENILEFLGSIVNRYFNNINFEVGLSEVNSGENPKYEINFTPEGLKYRYIEIVNLIKKAPSELKERWIFNAGRIRSNDTTAFNIKMYDISLDATNLYMAIENYEKKFIIHFYNESLSKLYKEDENKALTLAYIYADSLFGEIFAMTYIQDVVVEDNMDSALNYTLLEEQKDSLLNLIKEKMDQKSQNDPLLDSYISYKMKPQEEFQNLRDDVLTGITLLDDLILGYIDEDYHVINELQSNGICCGFIFYSHNGDDDTPESNSKILEKRYTLVDELSEIANDVGIILGGATGTHYSYIDFMAYDLGEFLSLTEKLMLKNQIEDASFQMFRKNVDFFSLIGEENDSSQFIRYDDKTIETLEGHINKHFGNVESVFHEIVSDDLHIDIHIIEPTPERNHYTLVTTGMSEYIMNIPEEIQDYNISRAELLISLPPDWNINSEEERWYWPLRWLKIAARLPMNNNTWLGHGHTLQNDGTFAENDNFAGIMLLDPLLFDNPSHTCILPDGDTVNFYSVVPIYKEEMDYKLKNSVEDLCEKFDTANLNFEDIFIVNTNRKNSVRKNKFFPFS